MIIFYGYLIVSTKYMYEAKQLGTQIVIVNPYKEPGMERYWMPSTGRDC